MLLIAWALLGWRALRQTQIRTANEIIVPPGIDSEERVQLGGVEQAIQIRGRDRTRPVLLILHGGPGVPDMPVGYLNAALEKDFVVVQWDQRGAGKSFDSHIPPETMRIAQIESDARELTDLLRKRFGQDRIFLAGHSTGTVIGVLLARDAPQLFRAYVGISQVANLQETEKLLYDFAVRAAREQHNSEAEDEMAKIGRPPFANAKELQVSQKWVNKFAPDHFGAVSFDRWRLLFFSPSYSLSDLIRMVRGAKFSFDNLWREFFAVDLFTAAPRLEVPVYFFAGRDDHVVTSEIAQKYFAALDAPRGKELIWFEHSSHWPQLDEPEKFRDTMVHRVLEQNRQSNPAVPAQE
ncbi:MAG: alpha/beta fold hydrolase [Chthoniobacterales bacterium]